MNMYTTTNTTIYININKNTCIYIQDNNSPTTNMKFISNDILLCVYMKVLFIVISISVRNVQKEVCIKNLLLCVVVVHRLLRE